jgi:sugar lactone lactonase YvrE
VESLSNLGFPESLRWRDGALWFSDMFRSRVMRWLPGHDPEVVIDARGGGPKVPGGLGWMPDGDLLVVDCTGRRLVRVRGFGGAAEVTEHADLSGVMAHPANEMHVDPDGTAWVGGYGFDPERDHPRSSTLVRVAPDGTVSVRWAPLVFPNGCERDAAGSIIVAETFADRVRTLSSTADVVLGQQPLAKGAGPDGLSIGPDGTVFVALAFAGAVVALRGGDVVEIHRPEPDSTGPIGAYDCAADPDGHRLAVAVASADEGLAMREDTGRIELIELPVIFGRRS